MQIMAATDLSTRSHRALRRAGLLASAGDAELTLVHVVDDDQPAELVAMERREVERILAEQIASTQELKGLRCSAMVVAGNPFDGILRAASLINTDLIVMGAHRKQFFRDVVVGTTVERVVRSRQCPVLVVNTEALHAYRTVLAPVDLSDQSAHSVTTAIALGLVAGADVSVLHAFDPPGTGKMAMAGVDRTSIRDYVAEERAEASDKLAAFVASVRLEGDALSLSVEEGAAAEIIARFVGEGKPDVVVLGTHGRGTLLRMFLGSVTEEVLRSVDVDILVVPPAPA